MNLCKQKALYVKACVIVNGVADYHGDILSQIDIKKIFTSYNNQDSFELYHNNLPIEGVSLLENYISAYEEVIAGTTIPQGSWNVVIRVDNPEIKQMLLNGDFGGVSLYNRVKTQCSAGLSGNIKYSDIADAECVIPIFISLVDEPANNVGLHIFDYETYIQKSRNGANKMSFLEKIKALVAEEEANATEPTIEKEEKEEIVEEEAKEEPEAQEKEEEKQEEELNIKKDAESEAEAEAETEEEAEEDTPQEDVDSLKEEIKELKEQIAKINEILTKSNEDEVKEEASEEKPVITKSQKINVTNEDEPKTKNFYEMTGRDPLTGMKIRK